MLGPLLVVLALGAAPAAGSTPTSTPTATSTSTSTPTATPTAAATSKPAPKLVLPAPPAGAVVDADLFEWTAPPTLTLGPADQVAGPRKARGEADASAKVWLALGPEGLWVAAEVRDDAALLPKVAAEAATADHLALWLALPAPTLPPVAFANQFAVLETPAACRDRDNQVEDRPACLRWHEAQQAHRERLARLFVRQYLLSPLGVTEAWASAEPEVAGLQPPCCAAAKVAAKAAPGGWRLEALLPLETFPATAHPRLDDLRLAVELADADQRRGKLEVLLAEPAGRKAGEPETMLPAVAAAPVALASDAPQPAARFRSDEAWAVFPAPHLAEALVFENLHHGYQYSPEAPSPEVTRVPLGTRTLARAGDLTLVEAAVGGREFAGQPGPLLGLLALRGEQVVARQPMPQGRALAATADGGGARALVLRRGSSSLTGSGACGACEVIGLTVVEVAGDGTFSALWSQWLNLDDVESSDDGLTHVSFAEVAPIVEPGLGEVGLSGIEVVEVGSAAPVRRPFSWRWRWEPAARRYTPADDAAKARERGSAGR